MVYCNWPLGTNEYWTALLLMRVPCMLYTHWKTYPSRAATSSTSVTVTLCSVLFWKEYIVNQGNAVTRSSPLSTVPLCIQAGSVGTASCLQMRVSWSEQSHWSSRETLKTAVRWREQGTCMSSALTVIVAIMQGCSLQSGRGILVPRMHAVWLVWRHE